MAEVLNVKVRDGRGKRESRRLRRGGNIPAVLYGHGEKNVALAVASDELASAVRHGSRVVELKGAVQEKALIRDLQWDTFGTEMVHVDFARVSEHERVHVKVKLELKGQAAGAKDGGVTEQLVHDLEIECEALSIPEKLELNIKNLKVEESLTAADLVLPPGVKYLVDPELVLVHCVMPLGEVEAPAVEPGAAEPEIIGRKAEEEEPEE